MTGFPCASVDSLTTSVDWIAAATKVSADRILRRRPAQIWALDSGVVPGGLMGAVKAILLVDDIVSGEEVVDTVLARSE